MSRYRSLVQPGDAVTITVDGRALDMPRGQSLLAALLVHDAAGAAGDFHCAIGQCQRCAVRVNGRIEAACLYVPRGGEEVETRPLSGPDADPQKA